MPGYYIHIDDPGFPGPPWPGQRRLGPYLTVDEATAQAVSDAAGGQGVAAGIYDDDASDALAEPPTSDERAAAERGLKADTALSALDGHRATLAAHKAAQAAKPVVTTAEIVKQAKAESKARDKRAELATADQEATDAALAGLLAPGVTPDDLRDAGIL